MLSTKHEKKSAIITSAILILLLFAMFNYGMEYFDPPIEYGVAINFGDSDVGSGEPIEDVQASTQNETVEETQVQEIQEEVSEVPDESVEENVLTDEAKDVPVVKKTKEKPKEVKKPETKPTKSVQKTKEISKPKPKPKPVPKKPSRSTVDALNSLMKGNSKGATKGEGDDSQNGVKGKKTGDPRSSKYYGNGGKGSGGNYRLAGRKALSKPIKKPDCQKEGTVVVTIHVNNSGQVTHAYPGTKGTTNSAPCLLKAAKEAALKTKWNSDKEAPKTQKGVIVYRFKLSQ